MKNCFSFLEVQSRKTFVEYTIRHDISGCLIGRGGAMTRHFLEGYASIIRLGTERENRSVTIFKPPGDNRTLGEAVYHVKRIVENQLKLYEVNINIIGEKCKGFHFCTCGPRAVAIWVDQGPGSGLTLIPKVISSTIRVYSRHI